MVNTKTTPMKACPMCKFRTAGTDELKEHLVLCGLKNAEKNPFSCSHCNFTTSKQIYLTRHEKRHQKSEDKNSQPEVGQVSSQPDGKGDVALSISSSNDSDSDSDHDVSSPEDWQTQDPGPLLSEESEMESSDHVFQPEEGASTSAEGTCNDQEPNDDSLLGRVIRKSTKPTLPFNQKRAAMEQNVATSKKLRATDLRNVIPKPVTLEQPIKRHTQTVTRRFVSVGVQTDTALNTTKRTVTTTYRYHEADKRVKQTTVDETFFYFKAFGDSRE
ncbi:uncharacterized protein [Argopecten irradians]|uniref:uncharacterized protein n=1 Tax=Argopecten irradians TaxID=31199 RepID=UPI0037209B78